MATMHRSVMLEDALAALTLKSDHTVLDATFGRGGHSAAILKSLGSDGRLYALDRDPEAAMSAHALEPDERFAFRRSAFANLAECAREWGIFGFLDGILFDLGVSSPQLDDAARGFSFMAEGPLDMRMDPESGESAAEYLARVEEGELARVLKEYGEERQARRIARTIVARRDEHPLQTTSDLVDAVRAAVGRGDIHKHPATRTFQAIRIAVNDELGQIESALEQSIDALAPGGRLVVISFHSLEDRLVKRFMNDNAGGAQVVRGMPFEIPGKAARVKVLGRAQRASEGEIETNPRARSAIMRVAEKVS